MALMRVNLKNSRDFFNEILLSKKISLKGLSSILSVNYSTLKKYYRGELTMPEKIYLKVLSFSSRKNYWDNLKYLLADNWGDCKGGRNSAKSDPKNLRIAHARKFRKIVNVDIKLNQFFCEFYGALLGDGCISKYRDYEGKERYVIQFSGNKALDSNYFKYLKKKLFEQYGIYVYYYEYKDENVCILSIKNKGFCLKLNKDFGVPIGLKYGSIHLSKKILNLPWDIRKFVLRGLFDTDGCLVANKREKYRYPWVVITSKSEFFRTQLIRVLREQNYPAYNTGGDICVRGIENVKKWFDDIGSSNKRNLIKYEYFLRHGHLPAGLLSGRVI